MSDTFPDLPNSVGWTLSGRTGFGFTGLLDEIRFSDTVLIPSQFLNLQPGGPSVTVDQNPEQADPTPDSPIFFSVLFSQPVTGFDETDVTLVSLQ
ncbi:MAG: hypothetical protein A3F68_06975 [Acidobacteria bacterium RIFCSPLOWO2_12_FULL_54_10]|nr:MAG: hypothetical protein A3F68_06975 [Acidobacteria bacterium RIFCSPLOWO2_12_FULL_54_10]